MEKQLFLGMYNINQERIENSGLLWEEIENIYKDYLSFIAELEPTANYLVERIRKLDKVHSTKMRIKNPEHLIEKIIRKKTKNPELEINVNNYKNFITDLIGIRALHLFKEDWRIIHEHIKQTWNLKEGPKANVRAGDDTKLFEEADCEIVIHEFGYRCVHYLVESKPSKEIIVAEIQVRTVFEEGWSEIDHKFRYPYDVNNTIFTGYLRVFNRLAGSADEMASFIVLLKNEIDNIQQKHETEIKEKLETIARLESEIDSLKIDQNQKDKLYKQISTLRPAVQSTGLLSTDNRLLSDISETTEGIRGLLSSFEENRLP